MPPKRSFPPLEFCRGTRPIHAARFRPERAGHESARQERADARDIHQPATDLGRAGAGSDPTVRFQDLIIDQGELSSQHRQASSCLSRHAFVVIDDEPDESTQALPPNRRGKPELRHVASDRIRELDALAHEHQPNAMQHHDALLLDALPLDEAHSRASHRLTDRLGIGRVVLLALDVGLHIAWRHQPDLMAELGQLACPMMRRGAGLDPDQAGRKLGEEGKELRSPNLPTDHDDAVPVDPVNLKD
jgi:hypothetical protein